MIWSDDIDERFTFHEDLSQILDDIKNKKYVYSNLKSEYTIHKNFITIPIKNIKGYYLLITQAIPEVVNNRTNIHMQETIVRKNYNQYIKVNVTEYGSDTIKGILGSLNKVNEHLDKYNNNRTPIESVVEDIDNMVNEVRSPIPYHLANSLDELRIKYSPYAD